MDEVTDIDSLGSVDRYNHDIKMGLKLAGVIKEKINETGDIGSIRSLLSSGPGSMILPDGNPLGLHFVMFVPTIMQQVRKVKQYVKVLKI